MVGIRRRHGVVGKPGIPQGRDEAGVHAARAGCVHEQVFIEETRPPISQPLLGDVAQLVDGALTGHGSASIDSVTTLVDVDGVRVEGQLLFVALQHVITLCALSGQLYGQVISDEVASTVFKLVELMQWRGSVGAGAHEVRGPVADSGRVRSQQGGIPLDRFRISDTDDSLCHCCFPLSANAAFAGRVKFLPGMQPTKLIRFGQLRHRSLQLFPAQTVQIRKWALVNIVRLCRCRDAL